MQIAIKRRIELGVELSRLARLGANLVEAHSFMILLPAAAKTRPAERSAGGVQKSTHLAVAGVHTLSNHFKEDSLVQIGDGILGFIAKHSQAVHVSPFERDSRLLGVYSQDVMLKSFLGFPLKITIGAENLTGVMACDSKKSYAFTKLQEKILEDFAIEITRITELCLQSQPEERKGSLREFLDRGIDLIDQLGVNAVEVARIKFVNLDELERVVGIRKAFELYNQIVRLVRDSLPAEIPLEQLPNGDLLMFIDNMVTSLIENKIESLCQHVFVDNQRLLFEFRRAGVRQIKSRSFTLEDLIGLTSGPWATGSAKSGRTDATSRLANSNLENEVRYERKRA